MPLKWTGLCKVLLDFDRRPSLIFVTPTWWAEIEWLSNLMMIGRKAPRNKTRASQQPNTSKANRKVQLNSIELIKLAPQCLDYNGLLKKIVFMFAEVPLKNLKHLYTRGKFSQFFFPYLPRSDCLLLSEYAWDGSSRDMTKYPTQALFKNLG